MICELSDALVTRATDKARSYGQEKRAEKMERHNEELETLRVKKKVMPIGNKIYDKIFNGKRDRVYF